MDFGDVISLFDGYVKEDFINARIFLTKPRISYMRIHIYSDNIFIDKIYTDLI